MGIIINLFKRSRTYQWITLILLMIMGILYFVDMAATDKFVKYMWLNAPTTFLIRLLVLFVATGAWGGWLFFLGKEKGRRERFGEDYMIIGQAQDHCIKNTIKDITEEFAKEEK